MGHEPASIRAPRTRVTGAELASTVRAELEPRRQEMVDLLGQLVRIESPSDDRAGLDRFADQLESLFGSLGSIARIDAANAERGRHLRLVEEPTAAHAVALCHYDTVWSRGTLDASFSVDADGVAWAVAST
jgi:glutamate carboxypeptidase